jgi:hypothetical protein
MPKTKQNKVVVSKDKDGLKQLSYTSTETELIPIEYLKELENLSSGSANLLLTNIIKRSDHIQNNENKMIDGAINLAKNDQHHQHILNYFILSMCFIILMATVGITVYFIIFNPSILEFIISIIFVALEIFGTYLFHKKTTNKNKS